jgi:hypothetical protein
MTMMVSPSITGYYNFGKTTGYEQVFWNNYVGSASLTKIMGRHNFKMGGEMRLMDRNRVGAGGGGGSFTFNNKTFTSSAATGGVGGNEFASFLLGYANSGTIGAGIMTGGYAWYEGVYFNDTFQINRKLTFNYGVRWEIPGSVSERYDRNTVFLPEAKDSTLSTATGQNIMGMLALVNSDLYSDRSVPGNHFNLFAPRVGIAYRATNNTVIRAGYGISYLSNNFNGGWAQNSPIATISTGMIAQDSVTKLPFNVMSNPFPASSGATGAYGGTATIAQFINQAAGRSQAYLDSLKGGNISTMVPDQPFPYVQQWNFVVEHQFAGNLMIGAGYAGSKGTHLPSGGVNVNQVDGSAIARLGAQLGTPVPNPFYGKVPATNPMGSSPNTTLGQMSKPFPQDMNVTNQGAQVGDTVYHSFQMKLEKRFGAGGVLMGNYTWAKIIGNVDTVSGFLEGGTVGSIQNYTNLRGERSLISSDVPHRMVASYVYDLPFGKGKKFASGVSGAADKLISGWGVNGIFTIQSGFPLSLQSSATNNLSQFYGAGSIRPNYVNGCVSQFGGKAQDRLSQWFNTSCFAAPGVNAFGNESRVDPVLRAAGVNNWDFSIFKNTKISERFGLQFRTEAFNLFNRVQFAPPNTSVGNPQYGKISAQSNQPRLIQFALRLTW